MKYHVPKMSFWTQEFAQEQYPETLPVKNPNPRKLDISDTERAERYKKLYGGCVADALYVTGIVNTVLDHSLKPLIPDQNIAGRVLPIKWHSQPPEVHMSQQAYEERTKRWEEEGSPQKKMHDAVFPGCVLVFDNGGDEQAAIFGEMSCQLAKSRGCIGVVNQGLTRDTQYIKKIKDFPYYTKGTTPNAYGGWRVMEVNAPIYLKGHLTHYVMVCPGDFVFGDNDGLQIIPEKYVDEVLLKGEEIFSFEQEERRQISEGMPIDQVYSEFGDL